MMMKEVGRCIKMDQEHDKVEKGRVIDREEVWKSRCDYMDYTRP